MAKKAFRWRLLRVSKVRSIDDSALDPAIACLRRQPANTVIGLFRTPGRPRRDKTANPLFSALPAALQPRFSHSIGDLGEPRAEWLGDQRPRKIVDQVFVRPFW
ncbi:hypothetical protein [Amycolatopsis sp. lyj-346]|uniref:hypothetical protein n=1 Tax=Amycolatopsis sp. lyj-346 TaxID=2789289 RepID=UPI00397AC556